jgi:hypothetical protein
MWVAICIFILALMQGLTVGYLWKYTRSRPLTYLVKGQVTGITISNRLDGPITGVVEYRDQSNFLNRRKVRP